MDSLVCQDNELLGRPSQLPRLGQELTRLTAILTRQSHRVGSPFPPVLKRKKVILAQFVPQAKSLFVFLLYSSKTLVVVKVSKSRDLGAATLAASICSPGKISICVPSLFVKDPGRCKDEKIQGLSRVLKNPPFTLRQAQGERRRA